MYVHNKLDVNSPLQDNCGQEKMELYNWFMIIMYKHMNKNNNTKFIEIYFLQGVKRTHIAN